MDITPLVADSKQLIQGYGGGGFRIAEVDWTGSVLVLPSNTVAWDVHVFSALSMEAMAPVLVHAAEIELLLIGCGGTQGFVPPRLRDEMRRHGIVIDAMDTGAACRTFNVLLSEERRVAAALIAI